MVRCAEYPEVVARRVHVRIPASTSNLGSGYDCLGMALDIWNELIVEIGDEFEVTSIGEGEGIIPSDNTNLVVVGTEKVFEIYGIKLPLLKYKCINRIPYGRGLGSSAAAVVAGVIAAFILIGKEYSSDIAKNNIMNIASSIEGHPDNVGPSLYGGTCVSVGASDEWMVSRVKVSEGLAAAVFVPDTPVSTSVARGVLPVTVSHRDASFNVGRVAILINALTSGIMKDIRVGMEDALHQPYRLPLMPHMTHIIKEANNAGAYGTALSGAGSSVLSLIPAGDKNLSEKIMSAMSSAASHVGVDGKVHSLNLLDTGVEVLSVDMCV
eukprot:GHVR01042435.1.p1 GENE.GHVR01042435.1~~GHVR01042435.1.p1  ORF type:complete len:324 (+),score=82.01 GHVR01042435.1:134-1105(+)